jgi:metallo-beta-lactamase family protein
MATIEFLGGTGTVTSSKFLVEAAGRRLLVDCGLYQGLKELRLRNWAPLPVDPRSIDDVVLTHSPGPVSGWPRRPLSWSRPNRCHESAWAWAQASTRP